MEKVKLPRSSYDELSKIISAYGVRKGAAGLDDIAHATGINRTVVSANNAFLTFVEIIEGGNKKSGTEKGVALARALEHEIPEEIQSAWSRIVAENDFLSKMLQALRIRRGMEVSQFENHIAYSSGEVKSGGVMTGARAVVDILLHSGKLRQEGDKLIADGSLTMEEPLEPRQTEQRSREQVIEPFLKKSFEGVLGGSLNLNIELRINATPAELVGLGSKIKSLLDEIRGVE